jgi:hypothetical protein
MSTTELLRTVCRVTPRHDNLGTRVLQSSLGPFPAFPPGHAPLSPRTGHPPTFLSDWEGTVPSPSLLVLPDQMRQRIVQEGGETRKSLEAGVACDCYFEIRRTPAIVTCLLRTESTLMLRTWTTETFPSTLMNGNKPSAYEVGSTASLFNSSQLISWFAKTWSSLWILDKFESSVLQ